LIRTPLEKLILKIKVWDCGEPEKILGRAIEPPNIKHIYAAIENLQNYGALTIPNDKSKTGELTELGKVYSELPIDIKYSRFIMLSFCFDIVEPAIIVCSILTQDKTIFRNKKTSMEVSIILKKHYEIRKTYDCGLNNDFVVFYNAYKAWSKNFGNEEGNSEFTRRYNKRVSDYEKRWCSENDLDFKVTREVRIVIADLKLRLKKLNVYSDNINKSFDFAKDKEALFYFNVSIFNSRLLWQALSTEISSNVDFITTRKSRN
jgi:HrpA-like RNA helicase